MEQCVNAVRIFNRSHLKTLVEMFSEDHGLCDFAERVVALHPCQISPNRDRWEIDFKSIRITRKAVESRLLGRDEQLLETYHLLRKIPEGSIFAGRIFEAIVHRMLSYGWRPDGSAPRPAPMVSNESDPPTFSTTFPTYSSSLSSFTPDTSVSTLAPLRAGTPAVTRVDFTDELSNMMLDNDKYYTYMPTTATPFFDSFTIHLDLDRHTAVVSVFKTATSPRYEESTEGYPLIREIMASVRGLLEGAGLDAAVKVVYFLVCPEDEDRSQRQWQMAVGWNKNFGAHSHRGDTFCVRVPVPGRYSTLNHGWI